MRTRSQKKFAGRSPRPSVLGGQTNVKASGAWTMTEKFFAGPFKILGVHGWSRAPFFLDLKFENGREAGNWLFYIAVFTAFFGFLHFCKKWGLVCGYPKWS